MNDMVKEQVRMKLDCGHVLAATCVLLCTLSSLDSAGKNKCGLYLSEDETEQVIFNFIVWKHVFRRGMIGICCFEELYR